MDLQKRVKLYKLWQKKGVRAFKDLPTLNDWEERVARNARESWDKL